MSDTAAVIGTAITTLGVIVGVAIRQWVQLRISKREGVDSEDVQAQPPAVPPDPVEGWERLVERLEARTTRLEQRLGEVEEEIKVERGLRWSAIHYIRRLHDWIAQYMPGHAPPPVPDELAPYLIIPRKDSDPS